MPEKGVDKAAAIMDDKYGFTPVEHLTAIQKGFLYTCFHGTVHFIERITPVKYLRRNIFKVPPITFRPTTAELAQINQINYITSNVSEDRIIVTTERNQLYSTRLWGPDISQVTFRMINQRPCSQSIFIFFQLQQPETYFSELGSSLHQGPISSLALCAWKPIVITCGELDRSLRVWDYEQEILLFVKEYQEDLHGVALHPSGLYATVGFSDKLRYMLVRIDDIEAQKELPIRACKECAFSSHGHLFAAVNGNLIQIYSTISFDNMYNLKGHNGKVRIR